ncbi:Transmembrane protein HWLF5 [Frankliniella fusca]|uniref:Transmembrane protein HWLF5 n=1 Tax=Frankliniella fusca TaxID=407009 RepID=A0AAE1GSH2_9NEOP|nr:Transmembrane protein HWLF5 [Frankliniella fusca]
MYTSITKDALTLRLAGRRRLLQILLPFFIVIVFLLLCSAIVFIRTRVPIRWVYLPAAFSAVMVQGLLTMLCSTYSYQLKVAAKGLSQYLHQNYEVYKKF